MPDGWRWTKVPALHAVGTGAAPERRCNGHVHSYRYRYYPPESTVYERCIGLSWCSACRTYAGTMVHVPRDETLVDPFADLGDDERDRLHRGERRLLEHLDRLVRRGEWPPVEG